MHPSNSSPSFTPLHANEHDSLLGYRSDAQATELYDEAVQRQYAVLSLLCALSGASSLSELSDEPLGGCIQAIQLLCSDAAGLYSAAWKSVQQVPA
jgi:hypothetical protein